MDDIENKHPKFTRPMHTIRNKAGYGGLNDRILEKTQAIIDNNPYNFTSFAEEMVRDMYTQINDIKRAIGDADQESLARHSIVRTVIRIKSSGGMFGHDFLSQIAHLSLEFIEKTMSFNDDALDVLRIHHNTMNVTLSKNINSAQSNVSRALLNELGKASERYFLKYK